VDVLDRRDLRLSRQVYHLRILGLALGFLAVGSAFYEQRAPTVAWALAAYHSFVWPHVAWALAKRSADTHRAERLNLTIDSAFGGLFIALMQFSLLPSVLIAGMLSMDKIGWGLRFLARTTGALVLTCAATVVLVRPGIDVTTTMREIIGSLPLMTAYPLAVAFVSYRSGQMARERRKALEDLAAAREELAHIARIGTLGEMAAGLAHELNQPLSAIHFEATAALEIGEFQTPDSLRDAMTTIAEQSHRAGEIVRRMRTFARRRPPHRETTDMGQVIRDVLALLEHDLRLDAIRTVLELDDAAPSVRVDRVEMQQVLVNVIRNAIEALNHPSAAGRVLTIRTEHADRRVRIVVADSGPGIDPRVADRLFHPFYSTKPSGMGLGLSICQSIVEAHGGRIGTLPPNGRGAVFFFELPAA
jgi:C4-dicarboxylate-specific signal transduction histidine kinase